MRACVTADGKINFAAWQALGEDVTTEEFVQLERVALFTADMQWESTSFRQVWVDPGERPVLPAIPGAQASCESPPRGPSPQVVQSPKSTEEIRAVLRSSRLLARKAQSEGMPLDADPVEWLQSRGYT